MSLLKKQFNRLSRLVRKPEKAVTEVPQFDIECKPLSRLETSFHCLPAELQYAIYLYTLSDLEIRVVLETDALMGQTKQTPDTKRQSPIYILSQASMSQLHFYQHVLFPLATSWRSITWESHVLFVFPSVLSLLDIFTSPTWPQHRIAQVQRLRLFEWRFFESNTTTAAQYGPIEILAVLARRGLLLDTLEYVRALPLTQVLARNDLLLCLPCYRHLHILGPQEIIPPADVRMIISVFRRVKKQLSSSTRLVDFPGTPNIVRDADGEILWSLGANEDISPKQRWLTGLNAPDRLGVRAWFEGRDLSVQLVAKQLHPSQRTRASAFFVGWEKIERVHHLINSGRWEERRRAGHVRDCFSFQTDEST